MKLTIEQSKAILSAVAPGVNWQVVGNDHSLRDAGLDSLDKITFIMKIEEAAGVKIPDDIYDQLDNIHGILAFVQAR